MASEDAIAVHTYLYMNDTTYICTIATFRMYYMTDTVLMYANQTQ